MEKFQTALFDGRSFSLASIGVAALLGAILVMGQSQASQSALLKSVDGNPVALKAKRARLISERLGAEGLVFSTELKTQAVALGLERVLN